MSRINRFGVGDIDIIKNNEKFLILLQHPVTTEYSSSNIQMKKTLSAIQKFNLKKLFCGPMQMQVTIKYLKKFVS